MTSRTRASAPEPCSSMMASVAIPGHTHTCAGKHSRYEDHFCPDCLRWWGTKR